MKRQALGKGLSSLIPETPASRPEAGLLMLDLDQIRPSQFQPRTDFTGLEGLIDSIRENGIVQPVIDAFESNAIPLHHYPAGTWGPAAAEELPGACNDVWRQP